MALLWKMICNLGDPMSFRHPVPVMVCENDGEEWVCVWQFIRVHIGSTPLHIGSTSLHMGSTSLHIGSTSRPQICHTVLIECTPSICRSNSRGTLHNGYAQVPLKHLCNGYAQVPLKHMCMTVM